MVLQLFRGSELAELRACFIMVRRFSSTGYNLNIMAKGFQKAKSLALSVQVLRFPCQIAAFMLNYRKVIMAKLREALMT